MTLIYLLRHAESTANEDGILAGRIPNIGLSARGEKQSRAIAKSLQELPIRKIYRSPLQRCRETIQPLLEVSGRRAIVEDAFIEMNYGKWSGRKLNELRNESLWKMIQSRPSKVKFPGGESFLAAKKRIKKGLDTISKQNPTGPILVVSHGDPIKIALQLTLDGELDKFQRIVIDPGSISVIDWSSRTVLAVNLPVSSLQKISKFGTKKAIKGELKATIKGRRVLGGGTDAAARL